MEDLLSLELVVVLGVVVLVASVLADRFRAPAPVLMLVAGALLGLVLRWVECTSPLSSCSWYCSLRSCGGRA